MILEGIFFHILLKILQYCAGFCKLQDFFSKLATNYITCAMLCYMRMIMQVKVLLILSCARFLNIAQDFTSFKILFFQNLQEIGQSTELAQVYAILPLILQFNFFPHILRKILQYCTRFCKL